MQNLTQGRFSLGRGRGIPPKKVPGDQSSKPQEILIPESVVSLQHTPQNFNGGQIPEHMQEWQELTSDKLYHRWLEEILLNLKRIFPQNIMQKIPLFSQRKR